MVFERLLEPGCRCGERMHVASIKPMQEGADAHVKVYKCGTCGHELRLTIWTAPPALECGQLGAPGTLFPVTYYTNATVGLRGVHPSTPPRAEDHEAR
jgi:hypothetical protein